ncbi:MAG: HAMP domain-containing protein [Rhodospirillales bacterium]|nr:HAMP domain-containing protein [Rhodospirillales bacterium]MBO6787307.1 HAMP domain-containing protein [Rhodospirillales bacterium]
MARDGTSRADAAPATHAGLRSRSLSVKFIATVAPIFLAVFLICIVIETIHSYETARAKIIDRLETVAANQASILAEPIAERNTEQLQLMLASIITEPNLIGIVICDDKDVVLGSFGAKESDDPDLMTAVDVNYGNGAETRLVGRMKLIMTDRHLRNDIHNRLIEHTFLGIALLVTALGASVFAHRRTVVKPLGKLLSAINESRGNALEKVDWQSDDEIGRLIRSYNDMQERLERYEHELRASHEQLEQRVEQRTHDLEQARENAVEANRVKSKFLSSMSHEFRTPMNAILGFTQVLMMSPEIADNPRIKDRLDKIDESAQSLMSLLDQIMEFSQLESADDELHLETLDTQGVIEETVSLVAPLAESRHVTVSIDKNVARVGALRADIFKLRKALFHVLSNAVKYNKPGGEVDVTAESDDGFICISISDTGHGIPVEQFEGVFEPFNRLGREAGSIDGSGIGLTITQRVIGHMSGRIDFDSIEEQGSTFRLWLPAAD